MNPYLITGPAQIGVSGGRTSGHMLYKILEAHGGTLPADVHLFFQNTGKEREETLVFIDQIAKRWNVNIVWMEWCRVYKQPDDAPWYRLVNFETASRNGEPFTMMLEYYAAYRNAEKNLPPVLPIFSNNMCTAYLKVKIGEKHMRALGYTEWDCIVGIRYDETEALPPDDGRQCPRRHPLGKCLPVLHGQRHERRRRRVLGGPTFRLGHGLRLRQLRPLLEEERREADQNHHGRPVASYLVVRAEERFGQVFRQDRADYKTMGWSAEQRSRQTDFDFNYLAEDIDCFCGD